MIESRPASNSVFKYFSDMTSVVISKYSETYVRYSKICSVMNLLTYFEIRGIFYKENVMELISSSREENSKSPTIC